MSTPTLTVTGPLPLRFEPEPDPFTAPSEPERTCKKCGVGFNPADLRKGRGRRYGEYPSDDIAPCGHSITQHGYALTVAGCHMDIYRGVHRMSEAALLEVCGLPRFEHQVLPLSICAEYNQLCLLTGPMSAADYLCWCLNERLADIEDAYTDAAATVRMAAEERVAA